MLKEKQVEQDDEKHQFFQISYLLKKRLQVSGQYAVWLPDGRLMTVAYTVDGENGFVPKISFDTNNPLG